MLAGGDRLSLPVGVELRGACLADYVRGAAWPLNRTGALVLLHPGRSLAEIADEVAAEFALPADRARADVIGFARRLNGLALVNVEWGRPGIHRLLACARSAARLAPAGALPPAVARRRPLDTRTTARAIGSCLAATAGRAALLAVLASGILFLLLVAAGARELTAPLAAGLATGAGVAIHESAHAALLRGIPSALVVHGRRMYILHRPAALGRRTVVALAGPLAAAAVGVGLVALGLAGAASGLAFAGCPLCAHACALTVLGGDGRVACGL